MKTRSHKLLLVLAALAALLAVPVLTANPDATLYPVSKVWRQDANAIKIGDSETSVFNRLGSPSHKATENIWIFHGYVADREETKSSDCRNLVIVFEKGKVVSFRLANDDAETLIMRQVKASPTVLPELLQTPPME